MQEENQKIKERINDAIKVTLFDVINFLKLVDSLGPDVANRERTLLRLFQFSLRDQASNWPERLPAGSISTWRTINQSSDGKLRDKNVKEYWELLEDLTLYDNESWNDPRDFAKPVKAISLPQDVPMNKITSLCEIYSGPYDTQYCMENPEQAFVDYESSRTDKAGGKWFTFKPEQNNLVLAHAPMYNAILDKYVEILELGKKGSAFIQGEMPEKMKDPELFTLSCRLGDSKPFNTLADLGSCVDLIPLYLFKKLKVRLLEETDHVIFDEEMPGSS
ncbi:hypothetical protein Tco_1203757 [Tanacetum coccineum]